MPVSASVQTETAQHPTCAIEWTRLLPPTDSINESFRHHRGHSLPCNSISPGTRSGTASWTRDGTVPNLTPAPRSAPAVITAAVESTSDLLFTLEKQDIYRLDLPNALDRITRSTHSDSANASTISSRKSLEMQAHSPESDISVSVVPQPCQGPYSADGKVKSHLKDDAKVLHLDSSSGRESDFAIQWSQLEKRRASKNSLRQQLRQLKTTLRPKADAKAIAEDKLFQTVRQRELGLDKHDGGDEQPILELMKHYEQARDEFGPINYDYGVLESMLESEEYELERLEREFFTRWMAASASKSSLEQSSIPATPSDMAAMEQEEYDVSYHPKVVEYLSKLGDLEIAQERVDDIYEEQDNLEDQREVRGNVGLVLGVDEQAWLDNSGVLLSEALADVQRLEEEVDVLKQDCVASGLVGMDGEPLALADTEQGIFKDETGMYSGSHVSEYVRYPILLPKPLVDTATLNEDVPDPGEKRFTLGGMVNKWMLDRLRTSALEVNLLARTYESEAKGKETSEKWQLSVLKLWYRDGTIGIAANSSSVTTPATYFSDTLVKYSNAVAKTTPGSMVEIRIWDTKPKNPKVGT